MKMRFFIFIFLVFILYDSYCQNDTLIINNDYVIFRGDTINKVDSNGMKQGLWLYYNFTEPIYQQTIWDFIEDTVVITSDIDSISTLKYGKHEIIGMGYYRNNLKQGIWKGYYENRNIRKIFNFVNDTVSGEFYYYYKNGNLKYKGNIANYNEHCKIDVYSKSSELIREDYLSIEELKKIFFNIPQE